MMNKEEIQKMENICLKITNLLQTDPGGRGLLAGPIPDRSRELPALLKNVERAALLTGFPVRRTDGEVVGETDGPLGIAHIAWALEGMGATVLALTDQTCFPQVRAAMQARGCQSRPQEIPADEPESFLAALFRDFCPTHLITLERPGKARDGHFYNMRGGEIDAMLTDTDSVMALARQAGAHILSVGDGGNELGMGALRPLIEERVPHGERICADEAADVPLIAGVSNWWGWGIAAICSLISGKDLLPSPEMEQKVLRAVIASGGADGCTGKGEETVDGLPAALHISLLEELRQIRNW